MGKDISHEDELKGFSFGTRGKHNLGAPDGYFDRLPDQVMHRWQQEKVAPEARVVPLRKMIAAAALVTGICLGITWFSTRANQVSTGIDISPAEAYQYITAHIDDFAPLLLQPEQWETNYKTGMPESSDIQEYLLEEMEDQDIETIF